MKVQHLAALFEAIKMTHRPEDTYHYYEQYVEISLEKMTGGGKSRLPLEVEQLYREKAKQLFLKYFYQEVTWPPEIEFPVPYALGTKIPLVQWKVENISQGKLKMLRAAVQKAGRVISCGFRLWRKIVMFDIDIEEVNRRTVEAYMRALEIAIRYKLPCVLTHTGISMHIYLPVDTEVYPDGVVLKLVRSDGRDIYCLEKLSQCSIVSEDGKIKLEIIVDMPTPYPSQSWLWTEVKTRDGRTEWKFISYTVPRVRARDGKEIDYPFTMKWFVWGEKAATFIYGTVHGKRWFIEGESYRKPDTIELFRQVLQELIEGLKLKVEGAREITLVPATKGIVEQGVTATRVGSFRVGVVEREEESMPVINLPYEPEFIFLFRNGTTFHDLLEILKILDGAGLLMNCVKFFLLDSNMDYRNKHYIFIVAWFILQNMKFWTGTEVEDQLAPHVAELHDLTPRLYYYVYYSNAIFTEDEILFPRPIVRPIKQIAEAHSHMAGSEPMCRECPFRDLCCRESGSATRKLLDVVDMLAFEIYHNDRVNYKLVGWLHPMVYERLVRGRVPALPRLPVQARKAVGTFVREAVKVAGSKPLPQVEADYGELP